MVKQIFTLIENKVPPSCVAAILFHCTIHYTILFARCVRYLTRVFHMSISTESSVNANAALFWGHPVYTR